MPRQSQAMELLTSQKTVEWYTPPWLIERARQVLGTIDLDPATSMVAQEWIQARRYFTKETDALQRSWFGNVWLNPPFEDTQRFVEHLIEEFENHRTHEALLLVNSNLGYKWFEDLWVRYPVCMLRDRVRFIREDGVEGGQAKRAQAVVLFHRPRPTMNDYATLNRFIVAFSHLGRIILPEETGWNPSCRGGLIDSE